MAITFALENARRKTASSENRARQRRAELRLEEVISVEGIGSAYSEVDRKGDLEMERRFATLYHLVDTQAEKDAVAAAFAAWVRTERHEEVAVTDSVGGSLTLLKSNNPAFIDGAFTPADSDGAA